jgi:hypothetical protein
MEAEASKEVYFKENTQLLYVGHLAYKIYPRIND